MKKVFTLLLCAMVLVLSGCQGRRLQDIKVTSARIVSIVPQGLTELSAVVEVEIHNPSVALEVSDITGTARFGEMDILSVSADRLVIDARTDRTYQVPLKGHIEEGFNPLRLLRLLGDEASLDDIKVSYKARVSLRGGIGKDIEMEEIPLSTLLSLTEQHEETQL